MRSKFRPARRLAVGGMAEVVLALQEGNGFEKLVVIKRVLQNLRGDDEFIGMFFDEARLAALLKHQNVIEITDLYKEDGIPHLVMEYVTGEDIRVLVRDTHKKYKKIPIGISCRIIADAAAGLAYAHDAKDAEGNPLNLVHRDIGPSNIMVSYDGVTKLLDFGVAKAATASMQTQAGTLKGKLGYLSPEQLEGDPVDRRTDIFCLGIVLHEMLTGKRLFHGRNEVEMIMALRDREIVPPSFHNPDVPTELDTLVLSMLQRDIEKRIDSAGRVHSELVAIAAKNGCKGITDLSKWMHQEFASTLEKRRAFEKEAVRLAREVRDEVKAIETNDNMLFGGTGGPAGRSGSFNSPYGTMTSGTVGSGSFGSMGSHQRKPTSRTALLVAGGFVAVLVVGALVVGFWAGKKPARAAAVQSQKMASLMIYAYPPGASIHIDGRLQPKRAGTRGAHVRIPADKDVKVSISRTGYATNTRTLRLAHNAVKRLHFNLKRGSSVARRDADKPPTTSPSK